MNTNMALPRHPSRPRRKRDWLDRLALGKVCFFCLLATALAFGFGLLLALRRYPALLRGVLDLDLSRVVSFFMPAAGLALVTTPFTRATAMHPQQPSTPQRFDRL